MDEVERLARRRRTLLSGAAVGFVLWQAGMMASAADLAAGAGGLQDIVPVAGFLLWAVMIAAIFIHQRRARPRAAQAALEDELTRDNRRRAFVAGYWTALAGSAGLYALSRFRPMSAAEVLPILIAILVAVPIFRFVALDRAGEGAEE